MGYLELLDKLEAMFWGDKLNKVDTDQPFDHWFDSLSNSELRFFLTEARG